MVYFSLAVAFNERQRRALKASRLFSFWSSCLYALYAFLMISAACGSRGG